MASQQTRKTAAAPLRSRVVCPHCWHRFAPYEVLWISAHPDLRGDPRLGEDAQLRFLPTRFDADCHAIDVKGAPCTDLACPNCHLFVSRALLELPPLFVSILGAPGSGKSYFLASMVWQLRTTLPKYFYLNFGDADPYSNQILNDYEEKLFFNSNDNELVALPKTEKDGDLYESVRFGDREVWYPKPFVFSIQPSDDHKHSAKAQRLTRALCLYDNAGEHFLPGGQGPNSPGTQHLGHSQALLFLFDPTQHPRFRRMCQGKTDDPQMAEHGWTYRQDQVLLEAAARIRSQTSLAQNQKTDQPLIVVLTKFDAWCSLAGKPMLKTTWVVKSDGNSKVGFDVDQLQAISRQMRSMLNKYAPELVTAAEAFSQSVTYIPASALGHGPELTETPTGKLLGVRPGTIRPMWAEIPLIYALQQGVKGLIPQSPHKANTNTDRQGTDESGNPRIFRETGS